MTDATDKKILDLLYSDADRPRKVIAKQVSLSEPSLSKKITFLQASKVIKSFSIDVSYEEIGYGTNSVTLIRMHDQYKGKVAPLISKIVKLNEAIEVYSILGVWDIYVRWLCRNNSQIMKALESITDESVAHTETITLATEHKRERGPKLAVEET